MIDLKALSDYTHHLNSSASDTTIAAFHAMTFADQLALAQRWANNRDDRADTNLTKLNGEHW